MLALPGTAVLAAFALPTLKRSATAAIDWFSMFFFSACAPSRSGCSTGHADRRAGQAGGQHRALAPGFVPVFSPGAGACAVAGTLAWLWLVRWRTGRHREALWKSLVLPAGGVALCWLLTMTLLLPPLDYARSPRPGWNRCAPHAALVACVAAPRACTALVAALEVLGRWRVDARTHRRRRCDCDRAVCAISRQAPAATRGSGWKLVAALHAGPPTATKRTAVYRRAALVSLTTGAAGRPRMRAGRTRTRAGSSRRKREPLPGSLSIELAAVALHHVLDDGQAQAGAAGLARAAAVDAVEALGQARQVLARDADARCR
jgi:hypothetical protein